MRKSTGLWYSERKNLWKLKYLLRLQSSLRNILNTNLCRKHLMMPLWTVLPYQINDTENLQRRDAIRTRPIGDIPWLPSIICA